MSIKTQNFPWKSSSIYGSSQVAVVETNMLLVDNSGTPVSSTLTTDKVVFYRGKKRYELSNHLGNVLAVITDRRIQSCAGSDSLSASGWIMYYKAQVVSVSDYYPFGSTMEERSWSASGFSYRHGFNGMEQDNEVKGDGNSLDFGARIYDSRLGRWMSTDPLQKKYPNYSPYVGVGNNPIVFVDPDGRDNVIYLLVMPSAYQSGGLQKGDATKIKNQANENFKALGLETRVVIVTDVDNFSINNIDKKTATTGADAVAVLGNKTDVISKITEMNSTFVKQDLKNFGGIDNFETSMNANGSYDIDKENIIAIDAQGLKANATTEKTNLSIGKLGGLTILHGAGHNADVNHKFGKSTKPGSQTEYQDINSPIMADLGSVRRMFKKGGSYYKNYKMAVSLIGELRSKTTLNQFYVDKMKFRFGTNKSRDNYKKNEKNNK